MAVGGKLPSLMRFNRLNLENFRNVAAASVELEAGRSFLIGPNGQGKTNLLEALGLVTSLRSFRTSDRDCLIRHGSTLARLYYSLLDEQGDARELLVDLEPGRRKLRLDGEVVKRVTDFVGEFPTVTLSADDIHLVRIGPSERRRALDRLLASAQPHYLEHLQRYTRALRHYNRALKDRAVDAVLDSFEAELAPSAAFLVEARRRALQQLGERLAGLYATICANSAEQASLDYRPDQPLEAEADWREALVGARTRARMTFSLGIGPQRDDFLFLLNGHDAADAASEGQQRALVITFRLAELAHVEASRGRRPVLLADDILGQLDPERQERFWQAVGPDIQTLATGTVLPPGVGEDWQVIAVEQGAYKLA